MKKSLGLSLFVWFLGAFAATAFSTEAKSTFAFKSQRKAGQSDRVVALMEVGGEFKEFDKGQQRRVPMSGVDKLVYHEMTLETAEGRLNSARYYEKADSLVKFKDGSHAPKLQDTRRLVGVSVDLPNATLYSLQEPLTRDELEVIDILGNSLLLDELLPKGKVSVGETWQPDNKLTAALFGLNEVKSGEVKCSLTEVTDKVARFELEGNIEGLINDATTRMDIKGRYRFDLRANRIDWFAILVKEKRSISQVASGFDVTVRLQMTIAPESTVDELSPEKLATLNMKSGPETSWLGYESPKDRWRFMYDRRWYLNSDDRETAVLKLIDQGSLLGICKISTLPKQSPEKMVTLEDYQEEVREALGKNFSEFVEAKQTVDPSSNHRILRVVAQGKSTDVPTHWVFYHVADQQGRQVTCTFTVDQENVEKFADSDMPIIGSLRLGEPEISKVEAREAKGEGKEENRKG